jgi:6-pyruvoyl-tetrahydropterin synthase
VSGPISTVTGGPKEGMAIDYADIKVIVNPIIEMLDHHHLGSSSVSGLYLPADEQLFNLAFPEVPTSENVLMWIASQLPEGFNWQCLALNETCTSEARIYATDYAVHFKRGIHGAS